VIFVKKFYKFHGVGVLSQDPDKQKEFQVTHIYGPKGGIFAMCAQLDLDEISKRHKLPKRVTNLHEFWS
jgi:hypothetical protein